MERRAGAREWTGLAVLALPCLVVSMDAQVLNLATARISTDLRPTGAQLLWIVDSYVFLVAGSLLTMGAVGDRVGRRRLLLVGAAVFAVVSVVAAFSTGPGMLIAARGALGVAGATLMPSTLALIRTMFTDPRQRTVALGVWTASFSLGGVLAPLVGGLLLSVFWWGSVLLVAVPVMALLLIAGPRLLPETRDPSPARLDPVSAALSVAAVLAAVYGLKRLAEDGWRPVPALVMLGGLALGAVFVRRQRRRPDPMVDPDLFRRPAFSAPLATNALAFFVLYGTQVGTAQYLQLVVGLSPLAAGLCTIPGALGYLLGSALTPAAARRAGAVRIVVVALAVAAVGFGLLAGVATAAGPVLLVVGSAVLSVGLAAVYILTTELTLGAAPPRRAGMASAGVETGAELGGALGIAVLGSLTGALYRHAMPGSVADVARRTIGGAVAVAERTSGGDELLRLARDAFTTAFAVTCAVGAALLAVAAVLAAGIRRRAEAYTVPVERDRTLVDR